MPERTASTSNPSTNATNGPWFHFDGLEDAALTFAFAHGAGAPMDTPFMDTIAEGVAAGGVRVARFEFPYMRARREDGKRRGPDRPAVLLDSWRAAVAALGGGDSLLIGGKSMGGRIASMVADEVGARGLICLGYPFHPPGRPERTRVEHLAELRTPTLILQGERDSMGRPDEVAGYTLSREIEVRWLADGDHSLKPRKTSGHSEAEHLATAVEAILDLARRVAP